MQSRARRYNRNDYLEAFRLFTLSPCQCRGIFFPKSIIRKEHTIKVKSAGEKIFFSDPAFYTVLGGDVGNAREALITMLCSYGGYLVETTKDETTGDFVVSKTGTIGSSQVKIEVGGHSKRPKKS